MKILTPGHRYELEQFEPKAAMVESVPEDSLAADALVLCHMIESLPPCTVATNVSTVAADLHRRALYCNQQLQFIEKRPVSEGSATLETVHNGTTNEEVLRVLIDRLNFLNGKFPCRENAVALTHLDTALLWLEKRTRDRQARGVEGKNQK